MTDKTLGPDLFPADHPNPCPDGARCEKAVVQAPGGRFFITAGHPGFNSLANNGSGYDSSWHARHAIRRHARPI